MAAVKSFLSAAVTGSSSASFLFLFVRSYMGYSTRSGLYTGEAGGTIDKIEDWL